MNIHHLIRGGLLATGVGIATAVFAASAGAGSSGVVASGAHAQTAAPVTEAVVAAATLPQAPAAVPVRIAAVELVPVHTEATATTAVEPSALVEETYSDQAAQAVPPVVSAGPGPASPVPGATTLIDPIEVVREPPVVQAGPGPASPVPGATTLIDPVAIDRADVEPAPEA